MEERTRSFFRSLPTLETPRLRLDALGADDADEYFGLGRDPDLFRWLSQEPFRDAAEAAEELARFGRRTAAGEPHPWAVRERPSGRLVGTIGFGLVVASEGWGDVGFTVSRAAQGRGYATEAGRAVLSAAFGDLGLHRVEAGCVPGHAASARVLEKLGMRREGVLRERLPVGGRFRDLEVWAILAGEYRALNADGGRA